MKSKLFLNACMGLLVLVALAACGKKPSFVDAPVGQETSFPRLYPLNGELPPGAEPEDIEEDVTEEEPAEPAPKRAPVAKPVVAPAPVQTAPAAISDEELNQFQ